MLLSWQRSLMYKECTFLNVNPLHKASFRKKLHGLNKSERRFKKGKFFNNNKNNDKEVLSANYTLNNNTSMTMSFVIYNNNKQIKIQFLVNSGSSRSFIFRIFVFSNEIPISGLSTPINIQQPNKR